MDYTLCKWRIPPYHDEVLVSNFWNLGGLTNCVTGVEHCFDVCVCVCVSKRERETCVWRTRMCLCLLCACVSDPPVCLEKFT